MPPSVNAAVILDATVMAATAARVNAPITIEPIDGGRGFWQVAGITLSTMFSLVLHGSVAAAMVLWWAPRPGAVAVPIDAISIELVASEVLEAAQPTPLPESAASPSSAQSEAGSRREAPALPEPLKDKPAESTKADAPGDGPIARLEEPRDRPAEPAPETPTGPRRIEPPESEPERAEQEVASKAEEALVPTPEPTPETPDLPHRAEPEPAPAETAKIETPPAKLHEHTLSVTKETRKAPTITRKASDPAKKGGEKSRARIGSARSSGRVSASTGSAVNYAALVRARVAARRPSGSGRDGTVVITFGVTRSGGLDFTRVLRSSGDTGLDNSVLAAVRSAAPFPIPPPNASPVQLRFTMPFDFR